MTSLSAILPLFQCRVSWSFYNSESTFLSQLLWCDLLLSGCLCELNPTHWLNWHELSSTTLVLHLSFALFHPILLEAVCKLLGLISLLFDWIFTGCRETGADGSRPAGIRLSAQRGPDVDMGSWTRFIVCQCSVSILRKWMSAMPWQEVFVWDALGRKMRKAGH